MNDEGPGEPRRGLRLEAQHPPIRRRDGPKYGRAAVDQAEPDRRLSPPGAALMPARRRQRCGHERLPFTTRVTDDVIARDAGLSVQEVREATAWLIANGWLEVESENPTVYRLTIPGRGARS